LALLVPFWLYMPPPGRGRKLANQAEEIPVMKEDVMNELRHEIHSPLAALRNALYLIALRCDDFQVLEYVRLAEEEAKEIAAALNRASASRKVKSA
jgi:nitrogen-specific signal transduction histidine kinase